MEREVLRTRLEEKYGKPVVFVTELIYCPDFRTMVPEIVVEARREFGKRAHRNLQRFLVRTCGGSCEAEKQIELDMGNIILVGHVDFVNHQDLRLYEIKPAKDRTLQYLIQLSIYTAMLRELTGKDYVGYFMWYRLDGKSLKAFIERPLALYLNVLAELKRYSSELAEIFGKKKPYRIFGGWCERCIVTRDAHGFSKIRWFFENGFLSLEVVP